MRSFFIGFAIVLLWTVASPLGAIWLLGERVQGRRPAWTVTTSEYGNQSVSGACVGLHVSAVTVVWVVALVVFLR